MNEGKIISKCDICDEWIYDGDKWWTNGSVTICDTETCIAVYARGYLLDAGDPYMLEDEKYA